MTEKQPAQIKDKNEPLKVSVEGDAIKFETSDKSYTAENFMKDAVGLAAPKVFYRAVNDLLNIIGGDDKDDQISIIFLLLQDINPRDSIEGLLAVQMVATHYMNMRMCKLASHPEQTENGTDKNINRSIKLSRTYATQMEALNKYRNKGKQTIQVQHVNVEAGGQAVVGNVNGGGNG
jgi:hypothetical protein